MHISQIPWILYGADGEMVFKQIKKLKKKNPKKNPTKKKTKPTPMEELIYFFKR